MCRPTWIGRSLPRQQASQVLCLSDVIGPRIARSRPVHLHSTGSAGEPLRSRAGPGDLPGLPADPGRHPLARPVPSAHCRGFVRLPATPGGAARCRRPSRRGIGTGAIDRQATLTPPPSRTACSMSARGRFSAPAAPPAVRRKQAVSMYRDWRPPIANALECSLFLISSQAFPLFDSRRLVSVVIRSGKLAKDLQSLARTHTWRMACKLEECP